MSFFDICMHTHHTEPVDGLSICLDCGSVLEPVLTRRMFDRTCELIRRDHRYGHHHSTLCSHASIIWRPVTTTVTDIGTVLPHLRTHNTPKRLQTLAFIPTAHTERTRTLTTHIPL